MADDLFHFSEDPGIARFEPRPPGAGRLAGPPVVWAIEGQRAAHDDTPRDCPRVCFWARPGSDPAEVDRLLGVTDAMDVVAIKGGWPNRVRACRLFAYRLPGATFVVHDPESGYHVSREPVAPLAVEPVGDLLAALVSSGAVLRFTPSLWSLHRALARSTLGFSMIRMWNAARE